MLLVLSRGRSTNFEQEEWTKGPSQTADSHVSPAIASVWWLFWRLAGLEHRQPVPNRHPVHFEQAWIVPRAGQRHLALTKTFQKYRVTQSMAGTSPNHTEDGTVDGVNLASPQNVDMYAAFPGAVELLQPPVSLTASLQELETRNATPAALRTASSPTFQS